MFLIISINGYKNKGWGLCTGKKKKIAAIAAYRRPASSATASASAIE